MSCDLIYINGEMALTEDLRNRTQGSYVLVKVERGDHLEPDLVDFALPFAGGFWSENE